MSAGEPATPGTSSLRAQQDLLLQLFPFHFTVGADGRIHALGSRWASMPGGVREGAAFDQTFSVVRPVGLAGHRDLTRRPEDVFVLRLRSSGGPSFRGQFLPSRGPDGEDWVHFVGGPWVTSLSALSEHGLELRDFPPHDPRGDMLLLMQVQESSLAEMRKLAANLQQRMEEQARLENQIRHIQKMELVGRLAGGMAHNFNNILMTISSYAELALMQAEGDAQARESLQEILAATEHATSITRGMLSMSRRHPVRMEDLDLGTELEELRRFTEPLLGRQAVLHLDVDPDVRGVHSDSSCLKQILMNLVLNARDAMPAGGTIRIHASVQPPEEHLAGCEASRVCITVADTGTGMDEATKARVFEPFFTTKPSGKGVGLGLPTVYGLVQQVGGSIDLESRLGVGTTFRVVLPAARGTALPAASRTETANPGGHVLLVDDDPAVRKPMEQLLLRAGYQVTTASSAEAAIETLGGGARFDAIVTDIVMTGLSGVQLAGAIEARVGKVPTILMSGHNEDAGLKVESLPRHQRFLTKPFSSEHLLATLRELLSR
jgi:signal transduction histidine kinase